MKKLFPALLCLFLLIPSVVVFADSSGPLLPDTRLVGEAFEETSRWLAANNPSGVPGSIYTVTSLEPSRDGLMISLAALPSVDVENTFDNFIWIGTVELVFGDGVSTPYATLTLYQVPAPPVQTTAVEQIPAADLRVVREGDPIVSSAEMPTIKAGGNTGLSNEPLPEADFWTNEGVVNFPWKKGYYMMWGAAGVHKGNWPSNPGWQGRGESALAVDWMTVINAESDQDGRWAPAEAYTADSGYVEWVCEGTQNNGYMIGGYFYLHLKPETDLQVGSWLDRSEKIGDLVTGSFSDGCGTAFDVPSFMAHLHFGFLPSSVGIVTEDLSNSVIVFERFGLFEDKANGGYHFLQIPVVGEGQCTLSSGPCEKEDGVKFPAEWVHTTEGPGTGVYEDTSDFFSGVLGMIYSLITGFTSNWPSADPAYWAGLNLIPTVSKYAADILVTYYYMFFMVVDLRFVQSIFNIALGFWAVMKTFAIVTSVVRFVKGLPLA